MADEPKKEEKRAVTLDEVHEFIKANAPMWDELRSLMAKKEESASEAEGALDADGDEDKSKEAMDAAIKRIDGLQAEVAAYKKDGVKQLMGELRQRDAAAREVEKEFGTFDHADMTKDEVLSYGLKKAGIEAPKGHEAAAWSGYTVGRKTSGLTVGIGLDEAPKAPADSAIAKTLAASSI